ncbi:glycerate kinase [Nostoc sp. FACHB-87]|uniref:glycerate kinase n=1 Tax=Nostocaceae TaxID=1162 RepID=UPI00168A09A9|nr:MULTISPECIES: glycerate kinase [Nostocaceae]MBD2457190.1 glycerate kinase [Nostoc sp. FACHB-87]MBD2478320.1 glycerate kinase [Anabaena sp. FACHB-83]
MYSWLGEIIAEEVSESTWQQAKAAALADISRAKAFGITSANVDVMIQARSQLLKSVLPDFRQFYQTNLRADYEAMLAVLWDLWLPLGMKLAAHRQSLNRPLIQGILGVQGTGKTTMCQVLSLILQHLGYRSLSWSLDDLYKTYSDRLILLQQDPRLIWRGPPGTHDVDLGLNVLEQIRQGKTSVTVPRFDKSLYAGAGDRTTAEIVTNIDIVLFEGWFVGVRSIDPKAFENAPPPIISDADKAFARDMNQQLSNYLPLWDCLDSLILLYPTDYRSSLEWRKQAEQQMVAAGKSGMSDSQIEKFVNYFWRSLHPELFLKPMLRSPSVADVVIEICPDRTFGAVYQTEC